MSSRGILLFAPKRWISIFVLASGVFKNLAELFIGQKFDDSIGSSVFFSAVSSGCWVWFVFTAFNRTHNNKSYLPIYLSTLLIFTVTSYAALYGHTGLCDTHAGSDCSHIAPQTALYFSMITWTTVGYGDITPNGDLARFAAAAEALTSYIGTGAFVGFLVTRFSQR